MWKNDEHGPATVHRTFSFMDYAPIIFDISWIPELRNVPYFKEWRFILSTCCAFSRCDRVDVGWKAIHMGYQRSSGPSLAESGQVVYF
jgi:hypothetical protein